MIFLSQRGVSILQALFISGVLAGMALLGTNMLADQKKAQKGSQTTDDITLLHQMVTNILQDKKHCSATLLKNIADSALTPGWKTTSPAPDINGIYLSQIGTGEVQTIENFILKATDATNPQPRYMNGNIYIRGIRVNFPQQRFEIDYYKVNGNSTSARSITKFVNNITFKNDAGIDTCFADAENVNTSTAQEFCQSLGSLFVWDPVAKDCALANHICSDPDTVFVGIRSDGQTICKKTGQYTDWANIIDSTMCDATAPDTVVSLQYVGGKIRLVCTPTGGGGTTGCTPINGGWSAWTPTTSWSPCSGGVESRTLTRSCNSPAPVCGGSCPADAYGTSTTRTETRSCGCQPDGTTCAVSGSNGYPGCFTCCNPPAPSGGNCCCPYSANDFVGTCGGDYYGCIDISGGPGPQSFCSAPPSFPTSWECVD